MDKASDTFGKNNWTLLNGGINFMSFRTFLPLSMLKLLCLDMVMPRILAKTQSKFTLKGTCVKQGGDFCICAGESHILNVWD